MTKHDAQAADVDATIARVSAALHLVDLRLSSIEAKLLHPSPSKPLTLSAAASVALEQVGDFVLYGVTYELTATDADDHLTLRVEIAIDILLQIKDGMSPTAKDLTLYGTTGVVGIAHPYVREIIQSLTGRMGLPPLVLDLGPPTPPFLIHA